MGDGCDPTDLRSYLRNGHATGARPSGPDRFRSLTGTAGKYWSTLPKTVPSWPVRRLLSDAAARFYRWTGQHRWLWPDPAANPRSPGPRDRKSTRLNSSHVAISYAVFCLKKKT